MDKFWTAMLKAKNEDKTCGISARRTSFPRGKVNPQRCSNLLSEHKVNLSYLRGVFD